VIWSFTERYAHHASRLIWEYLLYILMNIYMLEFELCNTSEGLIKTKNDAKIAKKKTTPVCYV
jgi:hypothetical protein